MLEHESLSLDVLDELLNDQIEQLRHGPLEQVGLPWFQAAIELLLKMHPEKGVYGRRRVVEALEHHAVLHGCYAVEHFQRLLDDALATWAAH